MKKATLIPALILAPTVALLVSFESAAQSLAMPPLSASASQMLTLASNLTHRIYDGDKVMHLVDTVASTEQDLGPQLDKLTLSFAARYSSEDIYSPSHPLNPVAAYIAETGYETPLYTQVNRSLRSGKKPSKVLQAFIDQLESSLDLFPSIKAVSYRGAIYSKRVTDTYQPGVTFTEKGYFSTSLSANIAKRFLKPVIGGTAGNPVLYVVYGNSGKPISLVAAEYYDEFEILYRKSTRFCVTGRSSPTKESKTLIVFLSEVSTDCSEVTQNQL